MQKLITAVAILMLAGTAGAQNVNFNAWSEDQKNMARLDLGYDFGLTAQLGYSRSTSILRRQALLLADYSFPMGGTIFDDFKFRYGALAALAEYKNFMVSARLLGNLRRYETNLVSIVGVGAETALVAGYYARGWHVAMEFGFDKSALTRLEHSEIMKAYHPGIRDGWYKAAGGHFFYGIQGSKSIGSFDVTARMGLTNAEGKDKNAILPYFAQLGLIKRF